MSVQVTQSEANEKAIRLLFESQERLGRANPQIEPGSLETIRSEILRPRFAGRQQIFTLQENGQSIAHCIARVSASLNDLAGQPLGMIGNFESLNQPAACRQLLATACDWFSQQGIQSVIGPINGDTWHKYRLNVGPWEQPPFLLEPTNPEYYPALWEAAGFVLIDSYHSARIDNVPVVAEATVPRYETAAANGYRFRPLNQNQFEAELETIYELSRISFRDNFLYEEISLGDFLKLYRPARPLVDSRLIWFAEDADGQPVGFLFCIVDYLAAVAALKGSSSWLAKLRFLLRRRMADAVNFKSIGVLPEHRASSVGGGLMHLAYREAARRGFSYANLCLIRDGNPSARLDGRQSNVFRRYHLYQHPESQLASPQPDQGGA